MKKGFTIIELIVALGIFTIVAFIGTSSILTLTDAQRKTVASQLAFDNLRFSLETIAKDIRVGEIYACTHELDLSDIPSFPLEQKGGIDDARDCPFGDNVITYKKAFSGEEVSYLLDNGHIRRVSTLATSPSGPVTSDDVVIEKLTFYVVGARLGDNTHPRVTISVRGKAGLGRTISEFHLQTSVSQLFKNEHQ